MTQNPSLYDLFGLNLYEIPSKKWILHSSEYDSEAESDVDIFSTGECMGNIICSNCIAQIEKDNNKTILLIEAENLLDDEVYEIICTLKKKLEGHVSYTLKDCERNYKNYLLSSNFRINFSGFGISCFLNRDEDTAKDRLVFSLPFFNNAYYHQLEEPAPQGFTPQITIENFFGIDLSNPIDNTWKNVGCDGKNLFYDKTDYVDKNGFFKSCSAIVNKDGGTTAYLLRMKENPNFYATEFGIIDAFCMIERDLIFHGNYSIEEGRRKFAGLLCVCHPHNFIHLAHQGITFDYSRDSDHKTCTLALMLKTPEILKNKLSQKYSDTFVLLYSDANGIRGYKEIMNNNFWVKILGLQYSDNYDIIIDKVQEGDSIQLKKEPDNLYDKNAIAAYYESARIGYVAKRDIPMIDMCMHGETIEVPIKKIEDTTLTLEIPSDLLVLEEKYGPFEFGKIQKGKTFGQYHESFEPITREEFYQAIK